MVGEASVRVKKQAPLGVSSKLAQYLLKESATTIAGIHHNMHSLKRMLIVVSLYALTNVVGYMARVYSHKVEPIRAACCSIVAIVGTLGNIENGSNIATVKTTLRSKEFQSVAIVWQMTCCHHY